MYELDQICVLDIFWSQWGRGRGRGRPPNTTHYNDSIRVYKLVMSIEYKRPFFQRLSEGLS